MKETGRLEDRTRMLPNHQLRKLPEGKLDLRLGSVKSDRMKAELEKTFGGDT